MQILNKKGNCHVQSNLQSQLDNAACPISGALELVPGKYEISPWFIYDTNEAFDFALMIMFGDKHSMQMTSWCHLITSRQLDSY